MEATFLKHAPKFINPKHSMKAIHGYTMDGEGFAWATDGIQLLRSAGFPDEGEVLIKDLKGRTINEVPPKFSRLMPELPVATALNVKTTLQAAKLLAAVAKSVKHETVELIGSEGLIHLKLDAEDAEVKGSVCIGWLELGVKFEKSMNMERLVTCLNVFDGFAGTVALRVGSSQVIFSAGGIDTLLLLVRRY